MGRKKKNVMLIGDGKGKTVISGTKSVQDKMTTFHTASFGKFSVHLSHIFLRNLNKTKLKIYYETTRSWSIERNEVACGL